MGKGGIHGKNASTKKTHGSSKIRSPNDEKEKGQVMKKRLSWKVNTLETRNGLPKSQVRNWRKLSGKNVKGCEPGV